MIELDELERREEICMRGFEPLHPMQIKAIGMRNPATQIHKRDKEDAPPEENAGQIALTERRDERRVRIIMMVRLLTEAHAISSAVICEAHKMCRQTVNNDIAYLVKAGRINGKKDDARSRWQVWGK